MVSKITGKADIDRIVLRKSWIQNLDENFLSNLENSHVSYKDMIVFDYVSGFDKGIRLEDISKAEVLNKYCDAYLYKRNGDQNFKPFFSTPKNAFSLAFLLDNLELEESKCLLPLAENLDDHKRVLLFEKIYSGLCEKRREDVLLNIELDDILDSCVHNHIYQGFSEKIKQENIELAKYLDYIDKENNDDLEILIDGKKYLDKKLPEFDFANDETCLKCVEGNKKLRFSLERELENIIDKKKIEFNSKLIDLGKAYEDFREKQVVDEDDELLLKDYWKKLVSIDEFYQRFSIENPDKDVMDVLSKKIDGTLQEVCEFNSNHRKFESYSNLIKTKFNVFSQDLDKRKYSDSEKLVEEVNNDFKISKEFDKNLYLMPVINKNKESISFFNIGARDKINSVIFELENQQRELDEKYEKRNFFLKAVTFFPKIYENDTLLEYNVRSKNLLVKVESYIYKNNI